MMARSLGFTLVIWMVATIWTKNLIQTELLDAYGIWWMLIQIMIFIGMGLSMATTVLVGQHAWAGHHHKAKKTAYTSAITSFVMMTGLWILIYIFAPSIINIFVPDMPKINELWTQMVRTSALFLWLLWAQMSLMWALRAIWKTQIPMFITILWAWVIKIPFIYFFSKSVIFWLDLWIKAIWISEPIQMIIIMILVIIIMLKIDWQKINIAKHEELIN
jgi:Na+-driven multidrug efflux pump